MFIIAIFGPSGSGKTTIANKIFQHYLNYTTSSVGILSQDKYYNDYSRLTKEDLMKINFDAPEAIDFDLLRRHLIAAKQNESFAIPDYDNKTATRSKTSQQTFHTTDVVIVEGHLLMSNAELRKLFDFIIYVDVGPDIALSRRINREKESNGQVSGYTLRNYESKIAPALREHILPYKNKAHCLLKNDKMAASNFDLLIAGINLKLSIVRFGRLGFFTPATNAIISSCNNKDVESKSQLPPAPALTK